MNEVSRGQRPLLSDPEARAPFILVVDDERRIADTLAAILASKGYSAEAAYDGKTALAACRSLAPGLLIIDEVMPGMDGIELATTVQTEFPECRILLFSGRVPTPAGPIGSTQSPRHKFDLLTKPVHPVRLLERIEQLIGAPGNNRNVIGPSVRPG